MPTDRTKRRVTPYSDYYKKSSRTPGVYPENDDDEEESFKFRAPKSRPVSRETFRKRVEEEEENNKMEAIRRRLKLASQLKPNTTRRK